MLLCLFGWCWCVFDVVWLCLFCRWVVFCGFFCLFVVVGGLLCTTSFGVCFLGWFLFFGWFAWSVLVVQVVTSKCVASWVFTVFDWLFDVVRD
jgi:hypothetical protein